MAFTTVALLGLITHPANMIMTIVPQAMSSLAAFERIRDYLSQPPRTDQRGVVQSIPLNQEVTTAITINDVTIQPDAAASPILSNVNINVHRGSIVIISGPVGSGKTMLSRCLLGELKPTSGSVTVSTKYMAYCDQTPWLPSGTIKQAICGFGLEDCDWYAQVIRLCCLDEDIAALPDGHDTAIGNRGSNLSGGQRQRLVGDPKTDYSNFDC
jgi:ABC-type bacteriocin/lantibiotic exporter with double-glycine peptidase domain